MIETINNLSNSICCLSLIITILMMSLRKREKNNSPLQHRVCGDRPYFNHKSGVGVLP
jgi:hypothetical protein